jgi:hypothetical protein
MEGSCKHSFKIQPDGSTRDSADQGLEPGRVEEKTGEEKTRYDPADSVKNPVSSCWLLFFY